LFCNLTDYLSSYEPLHHSRRSIDKATARLLQSGLALSWAGVAILEGAAKPKKSGSRVKYTCPGCGANAWGKDGLRLICADCDQSMTGGIPEGEEDS
jgi:hypothetical protein